MKKVGSSGRLRPGIVGLVLIGLVGLGGCTNTADVIPSVEPTPSTSVVPIETVKPSPKVEVVALTYKELSSDMLEIFELIYSKYSLDDVSNEIRLEAELIDVQDLMTGPTAILPLNGTDLYLEWRDEVHPYTPPVESEEPKVETPVTKPANPAVPQTSTEKDTQAQQSQSQQQAQQTDTSSFTYPPNSTTEGLSSVLIQQGLYARTDKDMKVYDQEGNYQGFRIMTHDDIIQLSSEHDNELYGSDDSGSMLDTSGAH